MVERRLPMRRVQWLCGIRVPPCAVLVASILPPTEAWCVWYAGRVPVHTWRLCSWLIPVAAVEITQYFSRGRWQLVLVFGASTQVLRLERPTLAGLFAPRLGGLRGPRCRRVPDVVPRAVRRASFV